MEKITTKLVIFLFQLNHIKEKEYSFCKSIDCRDAYIFYSEEEYYNYFLENGINSRNKDLLDLAIFLKLKNGDIIALKKLCDHIIDQVNKVTEYDMIPFDLEKNNTDKVTVQVKSKK